MNKKLLSILLCACLLLSLALPVCAEEAEPEQAKPQVTIRSAADFLAFAENCRLDSYSQELTVALEADIDLTGTDFAGVPIFSGTFLGNGHSITGLSVTAEGSCMGLFRYLTETAQVQELSVSGTVHPGGSREYVGGIAGSNAGFILNCSYSGSISGGDNIGGIAGVNTVTGVIDGCQIQGDIQGNHFVGGIAGENCGVVRGCTNRAQINTTPQQNSVEIADITMDTLTNSEAVNTVTDIGGIAGISSGVIRDCENRGDVGYKHMGYNIGGIAGTQSGYVADCRNYGQVQGRKEVGGIVGQLEPSTLIEYTQDTLQILQDQLGTMSGLVNRASSNAQTNASQITTQIGVLKDKAQTAKDAAGTLFSGAENGELPDVDTLLAAQNTLSSTISSLPSAMNSITAATEKTMTGLTQDLQAISGQISAMGQTINAAAENLGGALTDVSDEDTGELLTGKVEACVNAGSVLADLNAGGICGAMAVENDLDILEDWTESGEESLNFESKVRAVVLNCENTGIITGKKQNVGGIVGWQSLGLVKNSTNTGTVDGSGADNVGGISGLSSGFIRSCSAKCEITGDSTTGGIAGSAGIVTDSYAMVRLPRGIEKLGAILGVSTESDAEEPISGNYYLSVDFDPGAIDGISYSGCAEGLKQKDFLALEELPELFQQVTVHFLYSDGTETQVALAPGSALKASQIPAVPEENGYTGHWEGLKDADLTSIPFDLTFQAVYTVYSTTIQSEAARDNGLPLVLAQGSFNDEGSIRADASPALPDATEGETHLESWDITLSGCSDVTALRLQVSEEMNAEQLAVYVCGADGVWQKTEFTTEGRYLVIPWGAEDASLALCEVAGTNYLPYVLAAAAALAVLAAAALLLRKKKKSRKQPIPEETA